MTTLYITRHGETQWNIEGRMQGWNDSPLTKLGINQAYWLSDRLRDIEFKVIYSSPSGRAYKTSEILRGERNIEIIADDALREINLSYWEGLDQKQIKEKDEKQFNNYWNDPSMYKPFSGEDFLEVQQRVTSGIRKILLEHEEANILIVTHTMALKALMASLEGRTICTIWDPPTIKQTSLTIIEINDNKINIKVYADDSHHIETEKS